MVNLIGRRIDIQPVEPVGQSANVGALISQLGKDLFGDTLTPEVKRRQAEHIGLQNQKAQRELDYTSQLATSASDPSTDLRNVLSAGILSGASPSQLGDLLRVRSANFYGAGDERTTNAFVGAGGAYGSTVAGTREAEDTKFKVADLTSKRQADSQVRAAGLAPVDALDATGMPTWTTRTDIANGSASTSGLRPVLSSDQVVSGQMQRALAGASQEPPGAPTSDPLQSLSPSVRKKGGFYFEPQTFVDPQSNKVVTSFDGGATGFTSEGQTVRLKGSGMMPAGPETAIAESRLGQVKADTAKGNPALTGRDPLTGDIARSAYKASGVDAFGQEHVNSLLGSLGVTRLFGAGEVGPEYERARSNLEVFRQTAKSAFMNSPTSPIKEQRMIDEMLPGPAALANPETEARKVATLFAHLKTDNERLRRQIAGSPDLTTARTAMRALDDNEKSLDMLTRGAATAAPGRIGAQPAPGPAPSTAPPQPAIRRYNPTTGNLE